MRKMDLLKRKYIILELIPSHSNANNGYIVQLQALKLDGLELLERFDYRVNDNLISNDDLKNILNYDRKMFKYTENKDDIINEFTKWIGDLPLLIVDNYYTIDYLKNLKNKKESIFNYLNMELSDDVFDKLIKKYNLEPSNHLVDILYESLLMELKK